MKNFKQNVIQKEKKELGFVSPPITEYMTKELITFKPDTAIIEVIETLLKNRITGAPVLNDSGEVVGLIDDKDCLHVLMSSAYNNHPVDRDTVSDYMSNVMKSISHDADILDAATVFTSTPFKRLIVLDDKGKLVGQISRRDVLRAIKKINSTTW
ncbi:CBS domain-containing protein [Portibacter marinus]|uniref:CBS domain-containing protein n=1 Tax=Portibacter marinus TaxID=2898660 RepID=UPI001F274166|nr:CBS domain-containing protein [Portibacter marinus]